MPPRLDRREFLKIATTAPLFVACAPRVDLPPQKEVKESVSQDGQVVSFNSKHYIRNNDTYYPIDDFEDWKRRSKYDRFGKSVDAISNIDLSKLGDPYDEYVTKLPFRNEYNRKPLGGEINLYFPGFLTDGSQPYDVIYPRQDTFQKINLELFKQGFNPQFDSGYFGYGQERFGEFTPKDSAKSLTESTKQAEDFLHEMKKAFPMCRFNLIGHSLGGIMAMAAAGKYPDVINNVILLSSPVRGIQQTLERTAMLSGVGYAITPILGKHEEVSSALFAMAASPDYQKQLDDFTEKFVREKHGLYVFGSSKDPIIPEEAMQLKGAKNTIWEMETGYAGWWDRIGLKGHGASLVDPRVVSDIARIIGDNGAKDLEPIL